MPASSTNIRKSESMLIPVRNKTDMAEQMKALQRKMMTMKNNISTDHHKEAQPKAEKPPTTKKKTCLCSPTTHPGSFRCRLHRAVQGQHHLSAAAGEISGRDTPDFNFKCGGNLSPSKLSRFCSSR